MPDKNANPNESLHMNDQEPQLDRETGDSFRFGDGLTLKVEPNGLTATLEIHLDSADRYTQDDLERYLVENKVVSGIDVDAIQSIIEKKRYNEAVVVARGVEPKAGEAGWLQWHVEIDVLDGARLIEHQGKVDWKEQHHVLQVKKDQLLAVKMAPKPGVAGKSVQGQPIQAVEGSEITLPAGKNIRISDDGRKMYAEIDGAVSREGEKYSVSQTFEVPGDVSFKSGNIEYEGTVVIKGGVLSDFKVKSGQDIHVGGLVEGAELEAKGSVFIHGGIQGDQKGTVTAGGDIFIKYAHNARLKALGNIVIQSSITQSVVESHDRVVVEGPKGTITGGKIYAENEVTADTFGSETGTKTHIVLGGDLSDYVKKIRDQEKKCITVVENAHKLDQAMQQLNKLRDAGKITPQHEQMRLKIVRASMQQKGLVKSAQVKLDAMRAELDEKRKKQKGIVVRDTAWEGTTIQILDQTHSIRKKATKVIYAMPGDSIQEFGYRTQDGKESAVVKPRSSSVSGMDS